MANAKITDDALYTRAALLFRRHGFEGTSMGMLAEAAGIEKASLYYRFPGGKDELALAVAAHISRWFEAQVFAPLAAPGDPRLRLRRATRALRAFYAEGAIPCMLDTLSLPPCSDALAAALRGALGGLIQSFAALARDAGLRPALAARQAEQAVVQIEGSLVLARVLGSRRPFLRALAALPALLTPA